MADPYELDGGAAGKSFGAQFVEDLREAAEALLDQQKRNAGDQIAGVAEMLRRAAQAADPEDNLGMQHLGDRLAMEIEGLANDVRRRPLPSLMGDIEAFARREPAMFVLGMISGGFALERFLAASGSRGRSRGPRSLSSAAADAGPENEGLDAESAIDRGWRAGSGTNKPGIREGL